MNSLKPFMKLIFILLFLIFLGALLSNRFPLRESARLTDLELITPHKVEDTLFDDLIAISNQIVMPEEIVLPSETPSSEDTDVQSEKMHRTLFLLQNGQVLVQFNKLFRQANQGNFRINGPSARIPLTNSLTDPMPNILPLVRMIDLLGTQVTLNCENGLTETGLQALEGLTQLGMALCQNPSLIQFIVGIKAFDERNRLIMNNHIVLANTSMLDFPSEAFIQRGLLQSMWSEFRLLEKLLSSEDLEGAIEGGFKSVASRFLLNKEASIGYIYEDFSRYTKRLKLGILLEQKGIVRFNKFNPLHLIFNPIGRIIVELSAPMPQIINGRACAVLWQTHACQLLQATWQVVEKDKKQDQTARMIQLHLINPATGESYKIDSMGRLILLESILEQKYGSKYSQLHFNQKELEMLKGFPVSLPGLE